MRKLLVAGLLGGMVALLTVAGGWAARSTPTSSQAALVRIATRTLPKLGPVLVDSKGRTLYMFVPDKRARVTCVAVCARVWPPVKLPAGAKAVGSGAAKTSLLASDRDPAGGRVVTYNGWPLYTYVADRAPGQAKGQALNLNGGYWYVLSPAGKVIKTKLGSSGRYP
jgi:predicted lipoprotein with Yx(FWY)xxD motif